MAIFSGFLGLLANVSGVSVELSGGAYRRQPIAVGGTSFSTIPPVATSAFGAAAAPAGTIVSTMGIWDQAAGGNLIAWWEAPTSKASSTAAFSAVTLSFEFQGTVAANALVSTARVDAGSQIGSVNGGLPLVAGSRLSLTNSSFQAYTATAGVFA